MYPTTNNQIFVSIICWRDPFVFNTIESAYNNARNPENLHFGVIFQGYEQDQWMIEKISTITPNIKLINMKIEDLDTPPSITNLRGDVMNTLIENESYFLQIDSHMKFAEDWDLGLKAELKIANDYFGKSIINGWTNSFHSWEEPFKNQPLTTIPDREFFRNDDDVTIHGAYDFKSSNTQIKEKFYNANCIFAYREYVEEVQQPNNIRFWFDAPLMSLRTFTGGYNMVSPANTYLNQFSYRVYGPNWDEFIRYEIQDDPKFEIKCEEKYFEDRAFYNNILTQKVYDDKHGMLSVRSYEDFEEFVGYDPITLELNRPGMVEPENIYVVEQPLLDATIEEMLQNVQNSN